MIVGDYCRSSTNEAVKAAKLPWRKGPNTHEAGVVAFFGGLLYLCRSSHRVYC